MFIHSLARKLSGSSLVLVFLALSINCTSQSLKGLSVYAGLGPGKTQYYFNFHPVYPQVLSNNDIRYEVGWSFGADYYNHISKQLGWQLGLSHFTIREKSGLVPISWYDFEVDRKLIPQGFFHVNGGVNYAFGKKARIHTTSGIGVCNFINSTGNESSNALFNMDFNWNVGININILKRTELFGKFTMGLTKYDYENDPNLMQTYYYKYHQFQVGINQFIFQND